LRRRLNTIGWRELHQTDATGRRNQSGLFLRWSRTFAGSGKR
jgi:hypothetical protein